MIAKYTDLKGVPSFRKFLEDQIKRLEETAATLTMLINCVETIDEASDLIHERQEVEKKIGTLQAALRQRGQA